MKTILLAEDNPDDVWIMQRALKAAGILHPVNHVPNGREAVDYLYGAGKYTDRAAYPLPALVLLDLKMPYLSGLEVLSWIRRESAHRTLVAVFLTSSSDLRDVNEAYQLGANAYLVKPSELGKLTEMLKSMESFLLQHNQLPPETP